MSLALTELSNDEFEQHAASRMRQALMSGGERIEVAAALRAEATPLFREALRRRELGLYFSALGKAYTDGAGEAITTVRINEARR